MSRIEKLNRLLCSMATEAIEAHTEDAEQCAVDSINPGVDDDKPIRAKLGITIEWEAGSDRPKAKVKAAYSVKKTEIYESNEDLNQLEMFAPVKKHKDNNDE